MPRQKDTVWLTQRQIATLFDTSTDNISLHLKYVYDEAGLDESATTEDSSVVQEEDTRLLFLWYLRLNQHLLARPIDQLVNDNTLVTLAILVAESLPPQTELMVRLTGHFVLLKADSPVSPT